MLDSNEVLEMLKKVDAFKEGHFKFSSGLHTPARCPATLGSPLLEAHLPLPSIIMAICFGNGLASISSLLIDFFLEKKAIITSTFTVFSLYII